MKKFILKILFFSSFIFLTMVFEYSVSLLYDKKRAPAKNVFFDLRNYPNKSWSVSYKGDLNKNNQSPRVVKYDYNNLGIRTSYKQIPKLLFVGDSFTELNNLDQQDIYTEILSNQGISSVPIRTRSGVSKLHNTYNDFVKKNFSKPNLIVFTFVERNMINFNYKKGNKVHFNDNLNFKNPKFLSLKIFFNEFIDFPTLRFFYNKIKNDKQDVVKIGDHFYLEGENVKQFSQNEIDYFSDQVLSLIDELKNDDLEFIFLVIPNKETIGNEYFQNHDTSNIRSIYSFFNDNNIPYVDVLKLFEDSSLSSYDENDTHLSKIGSQKIADFFSNYMDFISN